MVSARASTTPRFTRRRLPPTSNAFCVLCAAITIDDLETNQIDAYKYKAFTQAEIDCDCGLYVEMPKGFEVPGHVLKLKKALEGI